MVVIFNIQEELKKLPDKPGVYIMKDKNDKIIYVGKASVLKNRVKSYFASQTNFTPKTRVLVENIARFEYVVTDSEHEALVLECNLIKKYRPKFNIMLMDDKNYPYIKITETEAFPRILSARKLEKDGSRYFGPYTSGLAVKDTLQLIKKLFPVKTCRKVLPKDSGKDRPCLNYHIGRCLAPCQGDITTEEYGEVIKDVTDFLNGKHETIIARLEVKMKEAAEVMDYEAAAVYRNRIAGLKHLTDKQKVLSIGLENRDVIAHYKEGPDACMQVFFIRGGKLIAIEHFIMEKLSDTENIELFTSFVKQFYDVRDNVPDEIILETEIEDKELIEEWLTKKRGKRVHILIPKRGTKKELVDMARRNAGQALHNFLLTAIRSGFEPESLKKLQELLGLDTLPRRIEAYDISNTGKTEITASMVVFIDGIADKNEYRRYRIRSIEEQNDYAAMQEVLFRRFRRLLREEEANGGAGEAEDQEQGQAEPNTGAGRAEEQERAEGQERESGSVPQAPDLVLLDGGKGHVNAAAQVFTEMGVDVNVFGMVKDDKHRTRALTSGSEEIKISDSPEVYRLISGIQDEAHRFALEYNKKLRSNRYSHSVLDEIDGIGEARKKALLKHFKSVGKIKEASPEELSQVEGISMKTAQTVFSHFHKGG